MTTDAPKVEENAVLAVAQEKSLKRATELQKLNIVIDEVLLVLDFKETGLFRISGSKRRIDENFYKMFGPSGDPTSIDLKNEDAADLLGLIKKGLTDNPPKWGHKAKEIFQKFPQNEGDYKALVEELIKNKAYEEAKVVHNLLYLCFCVAKEKRVNKMTPANIAGTFGVTLSAFLRKARGEKQDDYQEDQKLIAAFEDPYFEKSFTQTNPEVAQNMAEGYKSFPAKQKISLTNPVEISQDTKDMPEISSAERNIFSKALNIVANFLIQLKKLFFQPKSETKSKRTHDIVTPSPREDEPPSLPTSSSSSDKRGGSYIPDYDSDIKKQNKKEVSNSVESKSKKGYRPE